VLCFFPYPSGEGLTVGHLKNYISGDIMARCWRMQGFDVLHPMGWDAFGLPAENEARATGRHPATTTRAYAANYRRQMQLVSISYDWEREISSADPDYYRWTQWLFLLLYRRGLIYRAERAQWWCPVCQTVLANEQVDESGAEPVCWRGHAGIVQRPVAQWFARITDYADRLLADLDDLDWPEGIKAQQRHWIGRAEDPATGEVSYHLRDWSISRQRFWGAPVPIIHCPACGELPVPDEDLPVRLPEVEVVPPPGEDAEGRPISPLAAIPAFTAVACPRCGGAATRDTDTLDGFACSSWYFLRFASPQATDVPFEAAAVERWLPVDLYIGGAEHAVMHLLYARFWTKVLYDAGLVPMTEPFAALRNQGMVLDASGGKMSKSRPEFVITPDEAVAAHGADAVRAYILFLAPFAQDAPWQTAGIAGIERWLRRVWRVGMWQPGETTGPYADAVPLRQATAVVTRDVTRAIADLRFNSAVAQLMTFTNHLTEAMVGGQADPAAWDEALSTLLRLLAPIAPHIAEELWSRRGQPGSVHRAPWPTMTEDTAGKDGAVTLVLQVDGVVRGHLSLPADSDAAVVETAAREHPLVTARLEGRAPRRVIIVPGRLVNVVTESALHA
jgi:leucyl-tRNA synthetase